MFREIESSSQREDAGLGTHPTKTSSHRADRRRFPGHLATGILPAATRRPAGPIVVDFQISEHATERGVSRAREHVASLIPSDAPMRKLDASGNTEERWL